MLTKIKKPVSILLSLILVFSVFTIVPLSANAATTSSDGNWKWFYSYGNGGISDFVGPVNNGTLIMPHIIDGNDDKPLTIVDCCAFCNSMTMEPYNHINELIVEEGYTTLNEMCFMYADINKLVLPSTITNIGEYALGGSTVTEVELKGGTSIPNGMFCQCSNLTRLIVPDTITSIGEEDLFYDVDTSKLTIVVKAGSTAETLFKAIVPDAKYEDASSSHTHSWEVSAMALSAVDRQTITVTLACSEDEATSTTSITEYTPIDGTVNDATCLADGSMKINATFTKDGQSITVDQNSVSVTIPKYDKHDYSVQKWIWEDDTPTDLYICCAHCTKDMYDDPTNSHAELHYTGEPAPNNYIKTIDDDGWTVGTVNTNHMFFFLGLPTYANYGTVYPDNDYAYYSDTAPVWDWEEDLSAAVATFRDKHTENGTITKVTTKEPSTTQTGTFKATATVNYNGNVYTSVRTGTIPVVTPPEPVEPQTVYVGVIEYLNLDKAGYSIRYWGGADGAQDAELTALDTTAQQSVGDQYWNGDAQKFDMYKAEIPGDASGFKVHNGDIWFGDDGVLTTSNAAFVFEYGGNYYAYYGTYTEPATYKVTWNDWDGTELGYTEVEEGEPAVAPYDSLTRDGDAQFTYTFTGWTDDNDNFYEKDAELPAVTADITYTATFSSTVNQYDITWKLDAETVIDTTSVAYGDTPTHADATKAPDKYYTYTFAGWTPEITAVTGDAEYTAQFTPVAKTFMVFVKRPTGSTINVYDLTGETTVAQLKAIIAEKENIPVTEQKLIFAGTQLEDEKTLAEYNIEKESTLHLVLNTYTVTWKLDADNVIDTTSVAYGTVPTHEDPTKDDDEQYTYTFTGWDPEPVAVTGEATYTATFEAVPKGVSGLRWDDDGEIRYYINDVPQYQGLVQDTDGSYYYINSTKKAVKSCTYSIGETKANGLKPAGRYDFDADGKMIIKEGLTFDLDGEIRYYVDGVPQYQGLVQDTDGSLYYINSAKKAVKNCTYSISEAKANGLMPAGKYDFGADGKLIIKEGAVRDLDGEIRFYVDGVPTYAGLIELDGDYYYINSSKKAVKNCTYGISEAKANSLMPAGKYQFGADGKMILN